MTVTMPPTEVLIDLAIRLESRRRRIMDAEGPDALSQENMIAKLEHMRNQILIAATMSERNL